MKRSLSSSNRSELSGQKQFQVRAVVGGIFIRALYDPETVKRWSAKRKIGD